MHLRRRSVNIRHEVAFTRPAAAFAAQNGRLLEALVDGIGSSYTLGARDISMRSGGTLADWSLRISMFNTLGEIAITTDGVKGTFQRLGSDEDLLVVQDVQSKVLDALSSHSPSIKYVSETLAGNAFYQVVGGPEEREAYFSKVTFPGRDQRHLDIGFKTRLRHDSEDAVGVFDFEPIWSDPAEALLSFSVDTTALAAPVFADRARIANELVWRALESFDLKVDPPT